MKVYPIQFNPTFKSRYWAGKKLKSILNKNYSEKQVGESWEISTIKDSFSIVRNGIYQGKTIGELVNIYKGKLMG